MHKEERIHCFFYAEKDGGLLKGKKKTAFGDRGNSVSRGSTTSAARAPSEKRHLGDSKKKKRALGRAALSEKKTGKQKRLESPTSG